MVYGPTSPQPHFHGTLEKDEASPDSRAHCTGCTPSFVPGDDDDDDDDGDDDGEDNCDEDDFDKDHPEENSRRHNFARAR